MSSPKLTQSVLLEILVKEVESLKQTKASYDVILSQTTSHLERLEKLYHQPIAVDTASLEREHTLLKETLKTGIYLPSWFLSLFLALSLGFLVTFTFAYRYHQSYQDAQKYIHYLETKVRSLQE